MPQSPPGVSAPPSVLSIQRVAPDHSTAHGSQSQHQQMRSLRAVGNRARPHAWEPNTGAARTTALQTSRSRTGYVRVVPSEVVWAQKKEAGATDAPLAVDLDSSVPLNAEENQRLEACSWQLRFSWREFHHELVARALADLDPSWPSAERQVLEHSAHQLLLDTAPSELLAQSVFARFLKQPGCMHALLPATMKWLETHTDLLEQRDIARTGCSTVTASKGAYLDEMATLLGGRYDKALGNTTLLKIFDALHEEAPALRAREASYRTCWPQWAAWIEATTKPRH